MDRKLAVILGIAVSIMGLTTWLFYPVAAPPIPVNDRHYMHCSQCYKELPYIVERFDKACPKCNTEHSMVATKESLTKTGLPPTIYARLFPPLAIEVNLTLAAVLGYAIWKKKNHSHESFLYVNCGKCTQRLRYRADKIGATGQCPRCKRTLIFPEAEPDELALPWWKPARWRHDTKILWGRVRESARARFARKVASQPEDLES